MTIHLTLSLFLAWGAAAGAPVSLPGSLLPAPTLALPGPGVTPALAPAWAAPRRATEAELLAAPGSSGAPVDAAWVAARLAATRDGVAAPAPRDAVDDEVGDAPADGDHADEPGDGDADDPGADGAPGADDDGDEPGC
jgi:hypothetical protein